MILKKYDAESIVKYLKELQQHIYLESNKKIEIAVVIGYPVEEGIEVNLLVRDSARAKAMLEAALNALRED